MQYVAPVGNVAPSTSATSASGSEDSTSISIVLSGTDSDGTVASFSLSSLPSNGTLYTDAGLTTAAQTATDYAATANSLTMYFVPTADWAGQATFDYLAKDNDGGTDASAATATITVNAADDGSSGGVSVAGSTTTGGLLTASNTFADPDGIGTVTYNWTSSIDGHTASLGTASTYTTVTGDEGNTIRLTGSYTDQQGFFHSATFDHGPITAPQAGFYISEAGNVGATVDWVGKQSTTGGVTCVGDAGRFDIEYPAGEIVPQDHSFLAGYDAGRADYSVSADFRMPIASPSEAVNKWYILVNYIDASNYMHVELRHDEVGGESLRIYSFTTAGGQSAVLDTANPSGLNFANNTKFTINTDGSTIDVWAEDQVLAKATAAIPAALAAGTGVRFGTHNEVGGVVTGDWAIDNIVITDPVPVAGFLIVGNVVTNEGTDKLVTVSRVGGGSGPLTDTLRIAADTSPGNYWDAQNFAVSYADQEIGDKTYLVAMNADDGVDDGSSFAPGAITFDTATDTGFISVSDNDAAGPPAPTYTPLLKEDFETWTLGQAYDASIQNPAVIDNLNYSSGTQSVKANFVHNTKPFGGSILLPSTVGIGDDCWLRAKMYLPSTCSFSYGDAGDGDGWMKFLSLHGSSGALYIGLESPYKQVPGDADFAAHGVSSLLDWGMVSCKWMGGVDVPMDVWFSLQIQLHIEQDGVGNSWERIWIDEQYLGQCDHLSGTTGVPFGTTFNKFRLGDIVNGAIWIAGGATNEFWMDDVIVTTDTPNTLDNETPPHPYIHPDTKVSDFP